MTTGDEAELKFALAEKAYHEVLDATKHQDDKIGRLLTTIAFLTAAAVALANAGNQALLTARFHVHPYVLPVGALAFGGFVALVVLTVMILIASLTTPLRLPEPASNENRDDVSLLFFSSIAAYSDKQEWRPVWQGLRTSELQERMTRNFVAETHNLATRVNHKYSRTNEAVGVLSYALLLFAVSALLALVAIASTPVSLPTTPAPVHEFLLSTRLMLTVFVAGYCVMQIWLSWRERKPWRVVDEPRKRSIEDWYLILVAPTLTTAFFLVQDRAVADRAGVVAGAVLLGGLAPVASQLRSWRTGSVRVIGHVVLAAGAWVAFREGYAWQLAAGVGVPFVLALRGIRESYAKDRERRRKFEERRARAQGRG